jgi:Fur family ferric uptake transcriptional regulator/Fur family peroxide stress response transcriptional regulator
MNISPKDVLLQHNISPSVHRIAILNYLLNNFVHPTADKIYLSLQESIPTLSKATIYNTLNLLASKGAVKELSIDENNTRYDVDLSNHSHFMCNKCREIYDLHIDPSDLLTTQDVSIHSISEVQINIKGICNKCHKINDTI